MIINCATADDNDYGGGGHGHDAGGNHDTEYCWVCDDYDKSINHCKSDAY